MKRRIRKILPILLFALPMSLFAQGTDTHAEDREAVRLAVLDYVESMYATSPERVERSVSPDLVKVGYYKGPDDANYRESPMTYDQLLEAARTYNRDGRDMSGAPRLITVLDILDRVAAAKLVATWGIDYFHLVKVDDTWRIRHVVWQSHTPETVAATRAAMEQAAAESDGSGS